MNKDDLIEEALHGLVGATLMTRHLTFSEINQIKIDYRQTLSDLYAKAVKEARWGHMSAYDDGHQEGKKEGRVEIMKWAEEEIKIREKVSKQEGRAEFAKELLEKINEMRNVYCFKVGKTAYNACLREIRSLLESELKGL